MDHELQEKLQQRFPVLYRDTGKPDTGMVCGNGWFDLLWRLSEDLEKLNPALVASQVKEKFVPCDSGSNDQTMATRCLIQRN